MVLTKNKLICSEINGKEVHEIRGRLVSIQRLCFQQPD